MNVHVLVLAGGLSHEREVSLRSGARLAGALRGQGLEVTVKDADAGLLPWIAEQRPDAAVVALHGGRGENGAVQALLELAGVPFVGTASRDCHPAWDKATAKTLLRRAGFTTPDWFTLSHGTFRDMGADTLLRSLVEHLGLPLMVKPHQGGSALGACVVRTAAELPSALVQVFGYGEVALVERYVEGTEIAVSVVDTGDGPRVLPAVEIRPDTGIFDYEARYTAGLTTYHTPARLDEGVTAAAADLALGAHRTLGLRDVSRTDAIVTPDGTVHFLEVNVSPGLTETSLLPLAVQGAGEDLGTLYASLVRRAVGR